jgi:hypothetical protein
MTSGVSEECIGPTWRVWSNTVTDFEMPAGDVFDIAVVHLLTTSTIDRLRELYPQGRFQHRRIDRQGGSWLRGERLDRPHGR